MTYPVVAYFLALNVFPFFGFDDVLEVAVGSEFRAAPEAGVRINIMYPQIANYLEASGFQIVDLQPAAVRRQHRILAPVAWLIRLAALCIPGERRRRNHIAATASRAILLGGYYVFIEAVKPPLPETPNRR